MDNYSENFTPTRSSVSIARPNGPGMRTKPSEGGRMDSSYSEDDSLEICVPPKCRKRVDLSSGQVSGSVCFPPSNPSSAGQFLELGPEPAPPAACLFIGKLNMFQENAPLEQELYHVFSQWGHVVSVNVLRDTITHTCSYGFVQFETVLEAERVLAAGGYIYIGGHRLPVEKSRVNRTLFIAPKWGRPYTKDMVETLLRAFGVIEEILASDALGSTWFVRFRYRECAIGAYATLSNNPLLHVGWVNNLGEDTPSFDPQIAQQFAYIEKLPARVEKRQLMARFSRYGLIKRCVLSWRNLGHMEPVAYIQFANPMSVIAAIRGEHMRMFFNMRIHVQKLTPANAQILPWYVPFPLGTTSESILMKPIFTAYPGYIDASSRNS